ncbi:hypothetical protein [Luteolibacter sp. Populi]|uniref:hypothetical protein n=1 Tax=Luteolibacter sp. Populi TaxID=3230487 RepID=UPI003466D2E1
MSDTLPVWIILGLAIVCLARCCWPKPIRGREIIHRAKTATEANAERLAQRFKRR